MTTRLKGLTVVFERDIRVDDAQPIIDAIALLRGVAKVVPVERMIEDDHARVRVRHELVQKLWKALNDDE